MKKTYIIPTTQMVAVQQAIIANSPQVTIDKNAEHGVAPGDFEVKGDRGSRETYKVWNDDWSK